MKERSIGEKIGVLTRDGGIVAAILGVLFTSTDLLYKGVLVALGGEFLRQNRKTHS